MGATEILALPFALEGGRWPAAKRADSGVLVLMSPFACMADEARAMADAGVVGLAMEDAVLTLATMPVEVECGRPGVVAEMLLRRLDADACAAAYCEAYGKVSAGSCFMKSRGDAPRTAEPGAADLGKPREGNGGVTLSDMRELGLRTRDGTGIELPMVRFPSKLGRPARGVDVSTTELCPGELKGWLPRLPVPMRELGLGIALSFSGPTTRDRSFAELMRVSSAFILEIMSAIIRFVPGGAVAGVRGIVPPLVAALTDARRCARADGDEVRPTLLEGVPISVSRRVNPAVAGVFKDDEGTASGLPS